MNFFIKALLCIFFILLHGCSTPANKKTEADNHLVGAPIIVQGQATIQNGAKLLARKLAFSHAISNVSSQLKNTVPSSYLIGSTKVVDEWIADDIYHLQVLSVLSSNSSCNAPYRKKIVATAFPIVTSGQVNGSETQDLYSGIPREMMNILMESGHFIGRNDTHTSLYARPDMAPELLTTDYQLPTTIQVAQKNNDQFILSGVIRDFEVESTEYVRGAGIFAQIKSITRNFSARRGIAIDIYVHNGFSGALLFQHRYTDTVIGDVWIPSGYTVGSERFKSTPAGHKISEIIQLASRDINDLLSCYPFSTKVIKIEDDNISISGGTQNKLKQGDSLVIYSKNLDPIEDNKLIGVVNIQTVQANYSTGKMNSLSSARQVKLGDYVRNR